MDKLLCCFDQGIEFDGAGAWSFGNDFARNGVIFGVCSSSHTKIIRIR